MTRRILTAAAILAGAVAPARAFEAAPERLATFRSAAEPGLMRVLAEAMDQAAVFAPLALVGVVALYVFAEGRLFAGH